jgi:acetyl esterase/lipase
LRVRATAALRVLAGLLAAGALVSGCGGSGAAQLPPPAKPSGPALGSLAHSGAGHRFYEIYEPAGPARGTMLLIHGGAFVDHRGDARQDLWQAALLLVRQGWRVVNIGYSNGLMPAGVKPDPLPMLRDVVAFYDQIRRAFGGPICAYGQSAGGYLAAMLALERPTLRCLALDAAPLDLTTLRSRTDALGREILARTFGTNPSVLAAWSPAKLWRPGDAHTAVFATAASNDPLVPPGQLAEFRRIDPFADVSTIPGASPRSQDAFRWLHSYVEGSALQAREDSLVQWVDRIVPERSAGPGPAAGAADAGGACDRLPPPGRRWRLLLSGDAWQQVSTGGQPIAATAGCSGSSRWQDDGISLWALPSSATLPTGAYAMMLLRSVRPLHSLTISFRGFLARPQQWELALLASHQTAGTAHTIVAGCAAGTCKELSLIAAGGGALLAPVGYGADPDASPVAPVARFTLPAGTRRIAWQLRCIAPAGCSMAGAANPGGGSLNPRDPLGQPAIFSIYRVRLG